MLNLKKVKKIFLDFDGVVVDSNAFKEKAIENSVFKLLGKNKKTFEAISFFNENAGIARNLKLSKFFTEEIVTKILKLYSEECLEFFSKVRPEENLREFMKTIKLTDKQFQELHTYIVDTCENIMDRSLEWADSDLSNEIIDDNEIVFTLRSILDGVSK